MLQHVYDSCTQLLAITTPCITLPIHLCLQVVLPQLPADVSTVIEQHNKQVLQLLLQVLTQHMVKAADSSRQEHTLPLSGYSYFRPEKLHASSSEPANRLAEALSTTAVPAVLASPFMALSGHGDKFSSLSELLLAGAQGLGLYPGSVPLLGLQDRQGRELHLNAYAVDYFKHGQK